MTIGKKNFYRLNESNLFDEWWSILQSDDEKYAKYLHGNSVVIIPVTEFF